MAPRHVTMEANTLTPSFHQTRHGCATAAIQSSELILSVLNNACVSTSCVTARFNSIPEAALRSAPWRIRTVSIVDGSELQLHQSAQSR